VSEHGHSHDSASNIKVAFFLNLGFTILEIIGGILTNSVAILSDALHDLGDSLSLAIAWYLENIAKREADHRFSYGYRRFSLLGALVTSIVLIIGSLIVLSEAVQRVSEPQEPAAGGMILLAVIGIGVNGLAVLRVRGDSSLGAQAVSWHLLEDVLGWIAVLFVGVVLIFVDAPILDPVLSMLLATYVLYRVITNLRKTLRVFLQATPEGIDMDAIEGQLAAIEGVREQHHTHIWSLDGEANVLTTHLVISETASPASAFRIKCDVEKMFEDLKFAYMTIEIEFGDEDCMALNFDDDDRAKTRHE
jgi:cobalt-zinc-cadmium efflux system protein